MQSKPTGENMLLGSMIISMLLWGLSWPSAKVLTHYCSSINFGVYRYAIVIVSLLLILVLIRTKLSISKKGIPIVLISGALLALYTCFFYIGLKSGSAGAGGVLVTTLNPIMAYTLGIILKRSAPSRNEAIGLLLGLIAGCILLKIWNSFHILVESGNLYFLLAAFSWAIMSKFTSRAGMYGSSLSFSLWQYIITFLCLLPFINTIEATQVVDIHDKIFWLNLFFGSAIVTSLATTVYFYATTKLGAEKASSFIFMVPLAAAVSSWLFLDEKILVHTIVGGLMGICAVYMINKRKRVGT